MKTKICHFEQIIKERNRLYRSPHKQSVNHLLSFYTSCREVVLHRHRKFRTRIVAAILSAAHRKTFLGLLHRCKSDFQPKNNIFLTIEQKNNHLIALTAL